MVAWVRTMINGMAESGPYMGDEGKAWAKQARDWWMRFFRKHAISESRFSIGHYEFHLWFKIGDQWWYASSGDVRHRVIDSLLVRRVEACMALNGGNEYVLYSRNFTRELEMKLRLR